MKIVTYNVNGIRAAEKKGLVDWIKSVNADILCFQEVKAGLSQINLDPYKAMGYEIFWHAAEKKGYSGVATFTKIHPLNVKIGCNNQVFDREGRVLELTFDKFSLINVYMPSGTTGDIRQQFKYEWLDYFYDYVKPRIANREKLIICGDVNICHKPIDIHNPVANKNSSGFLPEERAWMDRFVDLGLVDAFRHFNKNPGQYTWWSFRANARARNLGWRIDYFFVTENLLPYLNGCKILPEAKHSDHCPVLLDIF